MKDTENQSLLKKLGKKILPFALSAGIIVGATACSNTNLPNQNTSDNKTTSQDVNNSTNEIKHGDILQAMISNPYYAQTLKDYDDASVQGTMLFNPLPFTFLLSENYSMDEILDRNFYTRSSYYIKDNDKNNLYISLRIKTEATTPYYTCYLLKYKLTNQDYIDFSTLVNNEDVYGKFFIQELSKQRIPEILNKAKITVKAYDEMLQNLKNANSYSTETFGSKDITFDFLNFSLEDNIFNINIRNNSSRPIASAKLRTVKLRPALNYYMETLKSDSSIFVGPSSNWTVFDKNELNRFKNNYEKITYYQPNNYGISHTVDFDKMYNN